MGILIVFPHTSNAVLIRNPEPDRNRDQDSGDFQNLVWTCLSHRYILTKI